MHVESRLKANTAYVHPYCLSLDTIGNALHSLVSNKYVEKQVSNGNKPIIQYIAHLNELDQLERRLRRYCSALKSFNGLSNYMIHAKL